jgi:hypothetical protein
MKSFTLSAFLGISLTLLVSTAIAQESVDSKEAERVVTKEEPKAEPAPKPDAIDHGDRWRFGLGVGLMISAPDATFSDLSYSDGTTNISGTAEFTYTRSMSLFIEGRRLPKQAWGYIGGLNIEQEREFEGGTIEGGGITLYLTGGSDASKVQFTTLYWSWAHRWETFYLPFGLNYSISKFTPASGFTGTHSASGSLGAQLGVAWELDNNFALELYSWVTTLSLSTSSGTESLDYGTGVFPSLRMYGKYIF